MTEDVLEVWRVHEEINLFLLEHIPDAGFQAVTLLIRMPEEGRSGIWEHWFRPKLEGFV